MKSNRREFLENTTAAISPGRFATTPGTTFNWKGRSAKRPARSIFAKRTTIPTKKPCARNLSAKYARRVYVTNVWDYWHLQDNTQSAMCDESLYPGERLVCPTQVAPKRMEEYKDKPWQKYLKPASGARCGPRCRRGEAL